VEKGSGVPAPLSDDDCHTIGVAGDSVVGGHPVIFQAFGRAGKAERSEEEPALESPPALS